MRAAIDMVSIWGLGFKAELWRQPRAGALMHQGAQRVLGRRPSPACCTTTSNACNAYQNALMAAAAVKVPATFVLGERDMMTPAKRRQGARRRDAECAYGGAAQARGHMMMV